jgi:hypothetical protein
MIRTIIYLKLQIKVIKSKNKYKDDELADNEIVRSNTVLETVAENGSPERNKLKGLNVVKDNIGGNNSNYEHTDSNEDCLVILII